MQNQNLLCLGGASALALAGRSRLGRIDFAYVRTITICRSHLCLWAAWFLGSSVVIDILDGRIVLYRRMAYIFYAYFEPR